MRDHAISSTPDAVGMLLKVVDHLRNTLQQYTPDSTKTVPGIQGFMDLLEEMMPDIQPKGKAVVPAAEETSAPSLPEKEPVQPVPAEKKGADKPEEQPETQRKAASIMQGRQDIRVDLSKLDSLINLVGELVIAETMVVRHPSMQDLEDESLERAIHQLERVSSDLQDVAMSVRMIPLATTFKKMTRLVYDLSRKSGKKIDLKLVGEDTEVDKTVIEHIGDPLVHIVRNAIDHGLESPEARREAGKPETGTVTIEARHEGGEVWIIISDDGRGLSREKILDKARSRGLVHGNGNDLRDEEVFKLVFEPGFSTAEKVTDISGRGVGMDVVKKNIEKLNGRVGVRSRPGQGSDFTLHIPLTLAIIDGMLVRVGDTQYAIPLLSIRESFRPTLRQITRRPDGQETVRVREEILPVLRLHEIFGKQPDTEDLCEGILVIVEADGEPVCLFVDELTGQQQTVIKGLSSYMGRVNGISGCTISGAGDVSLILDVGSLIRKAKETAAAMA
jgi:two-component system chemotaxis sensor kinase CheA